MWIFSRGHSQKWSQQRAVLRAPQMLLVSQMLFLTFYLTLIPERLSNSWTVQFNALIISQIAWKWNGKAGIHANGPWETSSRVLFAGRSSRWCCTACDTGGRAWRCQSSRIPPGPCTPFGGPPGIGSIPGILQAHDSVQELSIWHSVHSSLPAAALGSELLNILLLVRPGYIWAEILSVSTDLLLYSSKHRPSSFVASGRIELTATCFIFRCDRKRGDSISILLQEQCWFCLVGNGCLSWWNTSLYILY